MIKQLELFPELAQKLTSNLDEEATDYSRNYDRSDTPITREDLAEAYKDGALSVLTEVIDLLKKFTDLHES